MSKVLIIEDSPTNMMLAVEILSSAGHVPLEAKCALDGIETARAEHPDVILMDMHLPDIDGLEATGILKADKHTCDIPIIALTASAMKGDREHALACGCDEYIEKPVRYKSLLATIAQLADKPASG
ncbi:response regulator [Chitinivorax sp. B]|uniref:response regulator n=1 Tax=Chitinivorax sp. B TaxID=2502235 RepID=UPI0010F96297|nr:response regulator [Chitinivorax sp. B]